MSMKWPGGLIRKTPVTPAGPLQNGAAPGMWTLAEASYWTKQGMWPIAGNTLVVEDVFSTWLYTGTGAAQTITNGIDLSGQGGLVWIRSRSSIGNHFLFDTTRGVNVEMNSNTTDANAALASSVTAFNSNGFTVGSAVGIGVNSTTYASWTFREAPNFFDVVTYTGNGVAGRQIAHNLGVAPGMIIVKRTDTTADWQVYHRSNANTQYMVLNTTAAVATGATRWNSTTPTATEFTVGTDNSVNNNGSTYVAYLFAHDATSDGVIQCNSYTGNGSATGPIIDLGWEPQWLMVKRAVGGTGNWVILDNMRGLPVGSPDAILIANATTAEIASDYVSPTATGFQLVTTSADVNASGSSYIYIAIRRGPMRTPTLGTSVFAPTLGSATAPIFQSGFPVDLGIYRTSRTGVRDTYAVSRLTGTNALITNFTAAESADSTNKFDYMNGFYSQTGLNDPIAWSFRRAPGFMDVVCYTGTGVARTVNHNLGVAPELIIVKSRSQTEDWWVYSAATGAANAMYLNGAGGQFPFASAWNNTSPTASVFTLGTLFTVNNSGSTYVAYLFASAPGVSKVGSYTGNGSSQTINCAFTTGSRFVMIKRTDSTGDWYVWDSARGIVAGNDPYLALNTTAAEVTSNDSVDTDNTGFIVNQVAASNVNVTGGTYIFLAIA